MDPLTIRGGQICSPVFGSECISSTCYQISSTTCVELSNIGHQRSGHQARSKSTKSGQIPSVIHSIRSLRLCYCHSNQINPALVLNWSSYPHLAYIWFLFYLSDLKSGKFCDITIKISGQKLKSTYSDVKMSAQSKSVKRISSLYSGIYLFVETGFLPWSFKSETGRSAGVRYWILAKALFLGPTGIDQLHVVGIYHVLKAHNFPEFLGYVI